MSIKCKLCLNLEDGVCIVFQRKRSSGKKRWWCSYFEERKIVKSPRQVIRVPYQTKVDKKKEFLRRKLEIEKYLEKAKMIEQEKQKPIIIKKEPKVKEQKKGFLKKIFSRVRDK